MSNGEKKGDNLIGESNIENADSIIFNPGNTSELRLQELDHKFSIPKEDGNGINIVKKNM